MWQTAERQMRKNAPSTRSLGRLRVDDGARFAVDHFRRRRAVVQVDHIAGSELEIDVHLRIGGGFYAGNGKNMFAGVERYMLASTVD